MATQVRVPDLEDLAHAAASDLAADPIAAKAGTVGRELGNQQGGEVLWSPVLALLSRQDLGFAEVAPEPLRHRQRRMNGITGCRETLPGRFEFTQLGCEPGMAPQENVEFDELPVFAARKPVREDLDCVPDGTLFRRSHLARGSDRQGFSSRSPPLFGSDATPLKLRCRAARRSPPWSGPRRGACARPAPVPAATPRAPFAWRQPSRRA